MLFHLFIFRFVVYYKLFHLSDRYRIFCACAFLHWVAEVFAVFIDTNITITGVFFPFRRSWSLFLASIIIRTWSSFKVIRFVVAHVCYIFALQFLPIHQSTSRLKILLTYSIVLLEHFFLSTSDLTITFEICLIIEV